MAGNNASTITQLASVTWIGPVSGGNWSVAGNWAGGAIPDLSNVANVIIPVGSTVRLNGVNASPVSVSGGGLIVNAGTLTASSLSLDSYAQSSGAVTVNGTLATGTFSLSGGALHANGNLNIGDKLIDLQGGVLTTTAGLGNSVTFDKVRFTSSGNGKWDTGGQKVQIFAFDSAGLDAKQVAAQGRVLGVGSLTDSSGQSAAGSAIGATANNSVVGESRKQIEKAFSTDTLKSVVVDGGTPTLEAIPPYLHGGALSINRETSGCFNDGSNCGAALR